MALQSEIPELDERAFHELLVTTDRLVVVEFFMEGCPACRAMDPALAGLSQELSGKVVFARVDARTNLDTALRYGVVATPTFLMFCRETFLMEMVGVMPPEALRDAIADMLEHCSECAGRAMTPPFEMDRCQ